MKKKTKMNRINEENCEILDESKQTVYNNAEGTSNAVIIQQRKRKLIKYKSEDSCKPVEAKKRRIKELEKKQQSKAKLKKLSRILERKKEKESKESLIAALQQYQLPKTLATSVSKKEFEVNSKKSERNFLKKIRKWDQSNSSAKETRKQENYYETDSESDDSHENDNPEQIQCTSDALVTEELSCQKVEQSNPDLQSKGLTSDTRTPKDVGASKAENFPESFVEINETAEKAKVSTCGSKDSVKKDSKKSKPQLNSQKIVRHGIVVSRSDEITKQRAKLPIFAEEQPIVETVNDNEAVIICGQTGSGKTTQLPQFLYEAGYTSSDLIIGITEPRRIAAISMAERVAKELNLTKEVSYQIRYEGTRSPETRILFMTDGVLMKEVQKDVMLSKYSVIIVDEAHERSLYSDVLIGLLTRIVPLRSKTGYPLKLIIMSATLHLEHFTQKLLFPTTQPPVINVDARQFPVSIHYERRTPVDYLKLAYRKVCRIHETLPSGDILVFLSGRQEVEILLKWLVRRYPLGQIMRKSSNTTKDNSSNKKIARFDDRNAEFDELGIEDMIDDDMDDDFIVDDESLHHSSKCVTPLYCLPLFSLLSSEKQKRIFESPPQNSRLCIISTNVAETSITIPSVKYVVDSGKEKRRMYDAVTGVSQFIVHWISQASADQRSGRAGRVQAGHAYRLYSSAVFSDFELYTPPEILNKPVDQLLLQMKSMNIVKVANFPFPTRPVKDVLEESEKRLILLGALEVGIKNNMEEARVSALGRTLTTFPLAPKYSKILIMAKQNNLLSYACLLVAILSVREPMIPIHKLRGNSDEETQMKMLEALKQRRNWCIQGQSRRFGDLSVLLRAAVEALAEGGSEEVCTRCLIRQKALFEIMRLRQQLTDLINKNCSLKKPLVADSCLRFPTDQQLRQLRQIVIASLSDHIARRMDSSLTSEVIPKGAYGSQRLKDYLFIDCSSVLFKEEPEWILFQEIVELNGKKTMQNVIAVESEWLPKLSSPYCSFSEKKNEEPKFDPVLGLVVCAQKCTFGDRNWIIGDVDRPLPLTIMLYRQFARFFLDGSVCPKLAIYADKLLNSPAVMIRPWAKLQKKTEELLNSLIEFQVTNRQKLFDVWKVKNEYLLEEYLQWLPQSKHDIVRLNWPPI